MQAEDTRPLNALLVAIEANLKSLGEIPSQIPLLVAHVSSSP